MFDANYHELNINESKINNHYGKQQVSNKKTK